MPFVYKSGDTDQSRSISDILSRQATAFNEARKAAQQRIYDAAIQTRARYSLLDKALGGTERALGMLYPFIMSALFTGILGIVFFIALIALYGSEAKVHHHTVGVVALHFDSDGYGLTHVFNLNPTLWAALAMLIPVVCLVPYVLKALGSSDVLVSSSKWRWLSEGLFTPLALMVTVASWGVHDLYILLYIFISSHIVVVLMSTLEYESVENEVTFSSKLLSLAGATELFNLGGKYSATKLTLWCGILSLLPMFVLLGLSAWDGSAPPLLTQAGLYLVAISYAIQIYMASAFKKALQASDGENLTSADVWKMWFRSQGALVAMTILPKLIGLFLVGVAYTNSNDWNSKHGAITVGSAAPIPVS